MWLHTGVYGHRKRVCAESWLWEEKIPCPTKEWNLPPRHAGPTLHQLSYVPATLKLPPVVFRSAKAVKANIDFSSKINVHFVEANVCSCSLKILWQKLPVILNRWTISQWCVKPINCKLMERKTTLFRPLSIWARVFYQFSPLTNMLSLVVARAGCFGVCFFLGGDSVEKPPRMKLTCNSSENDHPSPFQLAEPLWTNACPKRVELVLASWSCAFVFFFCFFVVFLDKQNWESGQWIPPDLTCRKKAAKYNHHIGN